MGSSIETRRLLEKDEWWRHLFFLVKLALTSNGAHDKARGGCKTTYEALGKLRSSFEAILFVSLMCKG